MLRTSAPSEAVDRLRVVAHHRQVAVPDRARVRRAGRPAAPSPRRGRAPTADEQLQQPVLGVVGVLVLVHEHVAEGVAVALADLLEQLQQVDRAEQQVVEVHRVHAVQVALVDVVDVGDHLLELRADAAGGRTPASISRFLAAEIWLWIAAGVKRLGSTPTASAERLVSRRASAWS